MNAVLSYYEIQLDNLWAMISAPSWSNFFWLFLALSAFVWTLELIRPWRKGQAVLRKDFWLDTWYMFFNVFLFGAVGYYGISSHVKSHLASVFPYLNAFHATLSQLSPWLLLVIIFVVRDFIQWNIHRLLHASDVLWQFHKVHHSVEQMGYAAHLRYHFAENIIYGVLEYIPLALLGFDLIDFMAAGVFATAVGHLNHANFYLPLGPLQYIFNSPQMHIWHHAKHLPEGVKSVNYGLTLSVWDWLFGTSYMPHDGRDIELGFDNVESYPTGFFSQMLAPFRGVTRRAPEGGDDG